MEAIPAILAAAPDAVAEEDMDGRLPLAAAIDDGQLEAMHGILTAASLVSICEPGVLLCMCSCESPECLAASPPQITPWHCCCWSVQHHA